jgi:hypothetical protein
MVNVGDEDRAARIVAERTNVRCQRLDDGKKSSVADFELRDLAGKPIGLLEVTSNVDQARRELDAASKPQLVTELRRSWTVFLRNLKVSLNGPRGLYVTLPKALVQLEKLDYPPGFRELGNGLALPHVSPLEEELSTRGVAFLDSRPCRLGRLSIIPAAPGGALGEGLVTSAAQSQLDKLDNQTKLGSDAGGPHRWLFVFLEDAPAMRLHFDPAPPTQPGPRLPSGITGVWVASRLVHPPKSAVWFCDGHGPWRVAQPPAGIPQTASPALPPSPPLSANLLR